MSGLQIDQSKLNSKLMEELVGCCPFNALVQEQGELTVTAACRLCKLCVKKSGGAIALREKKTVSVNKAEWTGIAVFADFSYGRLHPVSLELLGRAQELAAIIGQPVYALLIGTNTAEAAQTLLDYGADVVYQYDDIRLEHFYIEPYSNAFAHFIQTIRPGSILVGATGLGRSLAPRVAARFSTGLTADCTVLDMQENTDLIQIRPAFGGNIMAQIVTPNHRPQFCTVRPKIFSAKRRTDGKQGSVVSLRMPEDQYQSSVQVLDVQPVPKEVDISDAEILVVVGRGIRKKEDLELAEKLAQKLNGQLACTRPLVENGWMSPLRQIGLSGRTVRPKLLITLGISGSVQFTAGMRNAECIVAVNQDPEAPIFHVAHYALVGDLYQVVQSLLTQIEGGNSFVS